MVFLIILRHTYPHFQQLLVIFCFIAIFFLLPPSPSIIYKVPLKAQQSYDLFRHFWPLFPIPYLVLLSHNVQVQQTFLQFITPSASKSSFRLLINFCFIDNICRFLIVPSHLILCTFTIPTKFGFDGLSHLSSIIFFAVFFSPTVSTTVGDISFHYHWEYPRKIHSSLLPTTQLFVNHSGNYVTGSFLLSGVETSHLDIFYNLEGQLRPQDSWILTTMTFDETITFKSFIIL